MTYADATLEEMKTSISEHESFMEMLFIVNETNVRVRRRVAEKILGALSGLSKKLQRLDHLKERVMTGFCIAEAQTIESDAIKLKTSIAGLDFHKQAIIDFIIYRASNIEVFDTEWTWRVGDAIPKIPKKSPDMSSNILLQQEHFSVPDDFLCPISRELMDDPVTTSDGFTFERNAIERQVATSSMKQIFLTYFR